jgi:tungstate transport system substrate-binding protein
MTRSRRIDRRQFVAGGAAATLAVAACSRGATGVPGVSIEAECVPPAECALPAEPTVVRVASVKTAVEGTVLPALIARFEHSSPYRVRLVTGTQVYDLARNGQIDLVVSHYGHHDAEAFVLDGLGEWPRTIFSNQMALLGPPSDPASVRGLGDLGEAFSRIAQGRHKYLLNDIDGVHYLTEILWNAAGRPDRTEWFLDDRGSKDAAIERASALGAYVLWGLTPFLRLGGDTPLALEPLVLADPLLQRMLVSIIVKPGGVRRVNAAGANALQAFLLSPVTQAAIRTIHYPGKQVVSWVPAGRHNRTEILPKV